MVKGRDKRKISEKARSMWLAKRVPHREVKDDDWRKYKGEESFQFAYANRCLREGAKEGDFTKIRDAVRIYREQGREPNNFLKNKIGQARREYENKFPNERYPDMDEVLEAYIEKRPLKSSGIRGPWMVIICFAVSFFFLSSNLTGNVIRNLTQTTSSWMGAVLFFLGLAGGFYFLKNRI